MPSSLECACRKHKTTESSFTLTEVQEIERNYVLVMLPNDIDQPLSWSKSADPGSNSIAFVKSSRACHHTRLMWSTLWKRHEQQQLKVSNAPRHYCRSPFYYWLPFLPCYCWVYLHIRWKNPIMGKDMWTLVVAPMAARACPRLFQASPTVGSTSIA